MTATAYTFDLDTFSDLHKDALGFRPSHAYFEWLHTATQAELQEEWDRLVAVMAYREAERDEDQKHAVAAFEASITRTITAGAMDRATAIQWLKEAEGDQYVADESYFEWLQGIPYGYIKKSSKV